MKVDGFDPQTHTAYQFSGCLYHGHDCREGTTGMKNMEQNMGMSREDILRHTREDFEYVTERCGYKLCHIWECEWNKMKKEDPRVKTFMTTCRARSRHNSKKEAKNVLPK